jgi:hypothetical protein
MDIREKLGAAFLNKAIDWMNMYVPADARPQSPPAWVARLPNRNLPATAETVTSAK